VPVSDPNVPSHIHRVAKAIALVQLSQSPGIGVPQVGGKMNPDVIARKALLALRENPDEIFLPPQAMAAAPPPDPKVIEAAAKADKARADAALSQGKLQMLPQTQSLGADKLQTQRDVAAADLQKEHLIHGADMFKAQHQVNMDRADQGRENVRLAHD